jgi:hypothetical protein
MAFDHPGRAVVAQFWGLRMADSIYKEQFIETETKMERVPFRLLDADEKSAVKY